MTPQRCLRSHPGAAYLAARYVPHFAQVERAALVLAKELRDRFDSAEEIVTERALNVVSRGSGGIGVHGELPCIGWRPLSVDEFTGIRCAIQRFFHGVSMLITNKKVRGASLF
jgi:hypothetical protein